MTYCIGREECGCKIRQAHDAKGHIIYCPKHYYAPDLYEALKVFVNMYVGMVNSGDCGSWNPEEDKEVINARKAIAKVEGK